MQSSVVLGKGSCVAVRSVRRDSPLLPSYGKGSLALTPCVRENASKGQATALRVGRRVLTCRAESATADKVSKSTPVVKICNTSDAFATVVTVQFGDQLGELLETITALKNMGLNIRRAKLDTSADQNVNTFYVTDAETSEKILRSARLEEVRMTIIYSLMSLFPETASQLAAGETGQREASTGPLGRRRRVIVPTTIEVSEASNGSCSVLKVTTRDRPGLLVDIVRVLKDINVNVVSAEVDTIGTEAMDEFFVTYHGEPLNQPMVQLVTNALQYYLSLAEVAKEESY